MLSFRIVSTGRAVEISFDDEGRDVLIDALRKVSGSHTHLGTFSGPTEPGLSETTPFGEQALSEVIITHGGD